MYSFNLTTNDTIEFSFTNVDSFNFTVVFDNGTFIKNYTTQDTIFYLTTGAGLYQLVFDPITYSDNLSFKVGIYKATGTFGKYFNLTFFIIIGLIVLVCGIGFCGLKIFKGKDAKK